MDNGQEEDEAHDSVADSGEDESIQDSSSIAEGIVTGLNSMSPNDDSNQPVNHLPSGKLRWAYAQLERCLETKEEPPARLLHLAMNQTEKVTDERPD